MLEDDYNPKMESIRPSVASLSSSLGNSPNRYSKNNPMTLSVILHSYAKNFSINIDTEWDKCAQGDQKVMSKEEVRMFFATISKYICEERGQFYDQNNFDSLFTEIDEDENGFLTRNEVAIFIKKAFRDPKIALSPRPITNVSQKWLSLINWK